MPHIFLGNAIHFKKGKLPYGVDHPNFNTPGKNWKLQVKKGRI